MPRIAHIRIPRWIALATQQYFAFTVIIFSLFTHEQLSAQQVVNSIANGPWSNASTWDAGVPAVDDTVNIVHAVTLDENVTLSVTGMLTINSGSSLVGANKLTINNKMTNNGTLNICELVNKAGAVSSCNGYSYFSCNLTNNGRINIDAYFKVSGNLTNNDSFYVQSNGYMVCDGNFTNDVGAVIENYGINVYNGNWEVNGMLRNEYLVYCPGNLLALVATSSLINNSIMDFCGNLENSGDIQNNGYIWSAGNVKNLASGTMSGQGGGFHTCGNAENLGDIATAPDTVYLAQDGPCNGNYVNSGTGTFIEDTTWYSDFIISQSCGATYLADTEGVKCSPVIALPIKLASFTAKGEDGRTVLEWVTAVEINNDYFTIERSANGSLSSFEPIVNVAAANNSYSTKQYKVYDSEPLVGTNYYRLKQTDYDGRYSYSEIVFVKIDGGAKPTLKVFPNPVQNSEFSITLSSPAEQEVIVSLYDLFGRKVFSKVIIKEIHGDFSIAFDNKLKLSPGVYLVTGSSNDSLLHKKLIIKGKSDQSYKLRLTVSMY